MNTSTTLLASTSPRRRSMLRAMIPSLLFSDVPPFKEIIPPRGNVTEIAQNLAHEKLLNVLSEPLNQSVRFIITADTLVAYQDVILGKPLNIDDARRMLLWHLGQTHAVVSAAWLFDRQSGTEYPLIETASVRFRHHSDHAERIIDAYLTLMPPEGPLDKAGAYGIQEALIGGSLIDSVEGSYEAIVGFPLKSFKALWYAIIPKGGELCRM